jgi:hypothetical protein
MSLSPHDMDFIEAKHAAAREIALALGVPPMLLGIPGDNTYSNLQESTRAFWRQTVLPLVARTAKALVGWLGPAYGGELSLSPDLDAIEALSAEREALWARLEKASFLTADEKRSAVGYGPLAEGGMGEKAGFRPDQPRVPAGSPGGGRWTDGGGVGSGQPENGDSNGSESIGRGSSVIFAARRRGGIARELLTLTVRQFVSQYCRARINRELPSEFEDVTIADVIELARGGDRAARTCIKLLERPRYRK